MRARDEVDVSLMAPDKTKMCRCVSTAENRRASMQAKPLAVQSDPRDSLCVARTLRLSLQSGHCLRKRALRCLPLRLLHQRHTLAVQLSRLAGSRCC